MTREVNDTPRAVTVYFEDGPYAGQLRHLPGPAPFPVRVAEPVRPTIRDYTPDAAPEVAAAPFRVAHYTPVTPNWRRYVGGRYPVPVRVAWWAP